MDTKEEAKMVIIFKQGFYNNDENIVGIGSELSKFLTKAP